MSRFQLIFTGVLVLAALAGAVLFAVARSNTSTGAPQLVMWGALPNQILASYLSQLSLDNRDSLNVTYVEKSPTTFESELIAALARGQGPDLILLPQDLIVKQMDKFYPIPFANFSERLYRDSFIEGSELYMTSQGIIGFPFTVDPIVMYWNRDIFSNAGVALPPSSWTELYTLAPKIIQKDANGNITQSLVAFGAMRNLAHAKDMVALLALQAGTPITANSSYGSPQSVLSTGGTGGLIPAEQAVNFFTEFSNPVKPAYSWNSSMPTDKNAFLSGKLALYFGYASELKGIRAANPNLNFDIAAIPQVSGKKVTFGTMNGIAILKASKNVAAGFNAAVVLTSTAGETAWVEASGYPPIRRDLLTTLPGDAYKAVFYQSALMAHAWLDPNREASGDIFARLIENVTSGKLRTSEAVRGASLELDNLFRTNI